MEGFISEKSESECLFGVNGDAKAKRGDDFDLARRGSPAEMGRNMLRPYAEGCGELGEEQGVAGAAAGDDELVDFGFGQDETVERVNDGQGGENSGGTDEVSGVHAVVGADGGAC